MATRTVGIGIPDFEKIRKKQYAVQLMAHGIPKDHIRSYGFAFEGKKVLIG